MYSRYNVFSWNVTIPHSPSLILNLCNLSVFCYFTYRHAQAFRILETSCSHLPLELTVSPPPVYLSKLLKRTLHWLFQLPGSPLATLVALEFSVLYGSTLDEAAKCFLKSGEVDLVIFSSVDLHVVFDTISFSWKPLYALFLFSLLSGSFFFVKFIIFWFSFHLTNIVVPWGSVLSYLLFSHYIFSMGNLTYTCGSIVFCILMIPNLHIQSAVILHLRIIYH